jgi:hypothetical protein
MIRNRSAGERPLLSTDTQAFVWAVLCTAAMVVNRTLSLASGLGRHSVPLLPIKASRVRPVF